MIHADNADRLNARMVIEGANRPTTPTADEILADKGVNVIPDILANAGGVVVSYFEWVQNLQHFRWDEREVNDKLGDDHAPRLPRGRGARAGEDDVTLRVAAFEIGIERVVEAARMRGYIEKLELTGRAAATRAARGAKPVPEGTGSSGQEIPSRGAVRHVRPVRE